MFIYSIAGGAPITVIDLGSSTAWGVVVSPDNARAFVPFGNELKVVNTATFAVSEIALTCTRARDIVIVQEILPLTSINLSPVTATNDVLTDHTVTATVEIDGIPEPDVLVTFEVTSGPNSGLVSIPNNDECSPNDDCTTDANGQISWTYAGSKFFGTDTIVASFFDEGTETVMESNTVEKIWVIPPRNIPTLSEWGLIAMAGILGIIGLWAIRRRKVTA